MSPSTGAAVRWMAIAVACCGTLILPVALAASQDWIFPDSISYLDMAAAALRDSPAILLTNGYWSPAYPAILAVMMAVARPAPAVELQAAYVLHWLLFLFAAACFSVLLWMLLQWLRHNSGPEPGGGARLCKALLAFGYAFFLLANMNQTVWYLTPDILVQGLVYLSAACALRLFLPEPSWKHSVGLGLTLGLGYLAKAAMFPTALLLIGILFLRPPKDALGRRHALAALACFCLLAAPLVLNLSRAKQRFTFGDTGKLNYAWFVGGIPPYSGWTGHPADHGIAVHAPRTLAQAPLILEFRSPLTGTHPLWFDASYWWDGLRVPVSVQGQLLAFVRPFTQVHSKHTVILAWAAAMLPLCLLNRRVRQSIRAGGVQAVILILWPAATCFMYSLVLFNFRYIVGYLVLICLGAAALVLNAVRPGGRARLLFAAAALVAVAGMIRLRPAVQAAFQGPGPLLMRGEGRDNRLSSLAVARELARLGIRPGDEISVLGHSLDCYYARLAGVRVVAQIWEDPDQIAGLPAPRVREVLAQLKQLGVKALISRSRQGFLNDEDWVAVPRTDVFVRPL